MSFFNPTGKRPSGIVASKPVIRKVVRLTETKPVVSTSNPTQSTSAASRNSASSAAISAGSSNAVRGSNKAINEKRRSVKRKPSTPDVLLSSESEGDESDYAAKDKMARKKPRPGMLGMHSLHKRSLRDKQEYKKDGSKPLSFIHSSQLVAGGTRGYKSAFPSAESVPEVLLQYPGSSRKERYQLVYPNDAKEYRPIVDILETVTHVLNFYLPPAISKPLLDDLNGIPHQLRRAAQRGDLGGFTDAVERYNKVIQDNRTNGTIASTLDSKNNLPFELTERIISQVYERIVSPRSEDLRKYESFSDSTYGEILPRFASQIFQEAELTPSSVFLDLGSGVGSVVLQAALEYGCEAMGIEFEEIPATLATAQGAEFIARTRLWGINTGSVNLLHGDFFGDARLSKVISRADVILVNNQAFSSITNDRLVSLFLDVKEGARIVSLKSFVPSGFDVDVRTAGDMRATLSVRQLEYWTGYVSWKDEGGDYYIATKDMTKLREFHAREKRSG